MARFRVGWQLPLLSLVAITTLVCPRVVLGKSSRRRTTSYQLSIDGEANIVPQRRHRYHHHHNRQIHQIHQIHHHHQFQLSTLRGGASGQLVDGAYKWCGNLKAPAALVAGAIVKTVYDFAARGISTDDDAGDSPRYTRFVKRLTQLLLISAFAMQIVSIFVSTVTS